ncbi:MAG: DUF4199 family protein [Chitinophagaceae bacterium]
MKKELTPLIKGVITGLVMVVVTIILGEIPALRDSKFLYLPYALYFGGIMWTLVKGAEASGFTGKFSELFGLGFRCFIIVTIIMVTYVGIFSFAHPEIAEQRAVYHRQYLTEQKDDLPPEIETKVQKAKDNFVITEMYSAIFGTMIIGAIFTLAGSTFVLMRRK